MFQKYSNFYPFLPMQPYVMFLLSILSCKRWFVNCLTVKFVLALSYGIVGVEKMVWHSGHFSLMKVSVVSVTYLKFLLKYTNTWFNIICSYMENQTIRISLKYWCKVMLHVLCISTWKTTNLSHTILPRQKLLTDTIYNGVVGNYYCIIIPL